MAAETTDASAAASDDPPGPAPRASDLPALDVGPLTGRGRTAPTTALLARPRSYEEVAAALRAGGGPGARGAVARGLGLAHGDAARNAGGAVLDLTGLDRIRAVDAEAGLVVCDAGVRLRRLAQTLLPLGWSLPVLPALPAPAGTGGATVGGALAADLHGGDHRFSGSFARHVASFQLLTADGGVRTVVPGTPLFDATAGGLGLTGVVLSLSVRLRRVAATLLAVDTERASGLDDVLSRLALTDHRYRWSTAWLDLLAPGPALGRGVLTRALHVPLGALPSHPRRAHPAPAGIAAGTAPSVLALRGPRLPALPADLVPDGLLGLRAARALNTLRFRAAPARRRRRLRPLTRPLAPPPQWDRAYGRSGFVRYECAVGLGHEDALHRIARAVARRGVPVPVASLQRLGDAGSGLLSFPLPGWALALDIPASARGLGRFLDELDEEVAIAGGRVALAHDARLRPELLAAMYPRLPEFRALRAELDPDGVLMSDLARRLAL
ncbi:FAD-binding oxidoreductase [Streptomyces sp. NBC_01497]|uniref:FAD-binding oxidoreductase n=1 Tax=Streptomyces sp. NBC_01497 TaxID=2903885 RepID=UPI002E3333D8|nr:FAD-binding oxidoreductase [Streptomyces sp. NBC_01497]